VVLCSEENKCDPYIKNYNPRGVSDIAFYRELRKDYTGTGSQTKKIHLSGYETKLKLSYEFYKEADQFTITDKSGKELFSTEMVATNGIIAKEIALRGVTQLIFKVKSSKLSSKWEFAAEIY
jgi:hypothetical protein